MGYRVWGLWAMGHRGYGPHGQWGTGVWGIWAMRPTGGIGYRGMGHMGNRGTWAIGAHGVWGTRGMGHMGNGVQGYEPHGERGPMGDLLPKYQKDVKLSKRCQVVKKMSNVKK